MQNNLNNSNKTENISEISERINHLISELSENKNSFAQKLGYTRSQTIYDIVNGKSAPSFDFFQRFMNSEFSQKVDIAWLITGKGGIWKTPGTADSKDFSTTDAFVEALKEALKAKNDTISALEKALGILKGS